MATTLSPEDQNLLNDLVASGEFRSQDEALAEALRFLREQSHNGSSSAVGILPPDEWIKEFDRGLSENEWNRYYELIEKRRSETLSEDEKNELVATSVRAERLNVRRMECLVELARLRDTTLPMLMEQLGIVSPSVI